MPKVLTEWDDPKYHEILTKHGFDKVTDETGRGHHVYHMKHPKGHSELNVSINPKDKYFYSTVYYTRGGNEPFGYGHQNELDYHIKMWKNTTW